MNTGPARDVSLRLPRGRAVQARVWLAKITTRDHFDAPAGPAALAAVDDAAAELAAFEEAALNAEAPEPAIPLPWPQLRAVEQP